MPPTVRPRGPLPARVYWVRRAVVLSVPLLMLVVLTRVLGGDGESGDRATQASAPVTQAAEVPVSGPTIATPTAQPGQPKKGKKGKNQPPATPAPPPEPVLAEPSGPCSEDDIVATPAVTQVPGGSDVAFTINLRTKVTEACTWQASPETFAVTITSGNDHIWSSQECPVGIAVQDVVVRQAVDAPVTVTWHARRSDETCSKFTDWARPGWYHIQTAALGGEATDVQFELVAPSAPVVTKTAEPKPGKKKNKGREHKPGDDGAGNPEG